MWSHILYYIGWKILQWLKYSCTLNLGRSNLGCNSIFCTYSFNKYKTVWTELYNYVNKCTAFSSYSSIVLTVIVQLNAYAILKVK